jgi:hypothetical protein
MAKSKLKEITDLDREELENELGDCHFDAADDQDVDWRKELLGEDDEDDDDDLPADQGVIDMLGFDPDEED